MQMAATEIIQATNHAERCVFEGLTGKKNIALRNAYMRSPALLTQSKPF
jgi:hypothetical protein